MRPGSVWGVAAVLAAVTLAGCSAQVDQPVIHGTEPDEHPLSKSSFSWDPHFPEAGETVRFEAHVRSSAPGDALSGLLWDFGDLQSTRSDPTYAYDEAGSHAVRLRIDTQEGGTWSVEQTVEVTGRAEEEAASQTQAPPEPDDEGIEAPVIHMQQDGADVAFSFEWAADADTVYWDFGDGTTSTEPEPDHTYASGGAFDVLLRLAAGAEIAEATATVTVEEGGLIPHVIIGIPDTGINPYHEMYYRPELQEHPCTYIHDFPCSVQELSLSVGPGGSWQERFNADRDIWTSIRPGTWYWIPQTVFVGVYCEPNYTRAEYRGDYCILDDAHMHGTGTTSSALMENPDALFAFKDGGSSTSEILQSGIPVDILSVSWGSIVPIPLLGYADQRPIQVYSAGNDPRSTLIDSKGDPDIISVGGAYANGRNDEEMSAKHAEVVSYYCRPVAQTRSISDMRDSYCGTSFSAPTVAGALSKVILGLRQESGYTGTIQEDMVDPILGVSKGDLRSAMNRTASYDPDAKYSNSWLLGPPLNPVAPWAQWGWGFYDGWVADATLGHMLGTAEAPPKPDAARDYMETMFLAKDLTHI